ncbi:prepilin-type N-terminal cleavage/methylation domain-containing protein [bacterium]|nr:MAG: prepilin-type N-terminal cleavage/methylation domain-containing protein [bacterium]
MTKINKSFTLIEVMVAAAIVAIALVAVSQTFSMGIELSYSAEKETMAVALAQEKLEETIALGYDNILEGVSLRERFSDDSESHFYAFENQVEVNYIDVNLEESISDTGLKKIKVNVFWPNRKGEKEENLILLIAKK